VERYEPREIEGRWAVYDTVAGRVTGWFGRGESEAAGADSHAREMNEVAATPLEEDDGEEPVSLLAARARHEVLSQRSKDGPRTNP
jgi:hypothetical protein